jgi:hypothetical protein
MGHTHTHTHKYTHRHHTSPAETGHLWSRDTCHPYMASASKKTFHFRNTHTHTHTHTDIIPVLLRPGTLRFAIRATHTRPLRRERRPIFAVVSLLTNFAVPLGACLPAPVPVWADGAIRKRPVCIACMLFSQRPYYCHSHNNWGPRTSFQRLLVPVYYWKTIQKPETDPQLLWEWQ